MFTKWVTFSRFNCLPKKLWTLAGKGNLLQCPQICADAVNYSWPTWTGTLNRSRMLTSTPWAIRRRPWYLPCRGKSLAAGFCSIAGLKATAASPYLQSLYISIHHVILFNARFSHVMPNWQPGIIRPTSNARPDQKLTHLEHFKLFHCQVLFS